MFTVKLMKYVTGEGQIPTCTELQVMRGAEVVYTEFDKHGRTVLRLHDSKGQEEAITIGAAERDDVMFNAAYVMNDAGKTVDTIR